MRAQLAADPQLSRRWRAVKQFQADRLRATYPDLLASDRYRGPCEFFLEELYGAQDFDQRDAEAQRVAEARENAARPRRRDAAHGGPARRDVGALRLRAGSHAERAGHRRDVCGRVSHRRHCGRTRAPDRLVDEIGRALDRLARIPMLSTMLHMMKVRPKCGACRICITSCSAASTRSPAWGAHGTSWQRSGAANRPSISACSPAIRSRSGRSTARSGPDAHDARARPAVVQQPTLRIDEAGSSSSAKPSASAPRRRLRGSGTAPPRRAPAARGATRARSAGRRAQRAARAVIGQHFQVPGLQRQRLAGSRPAPDEVAADRSEEHRLQHAARTGWQGVSSTGRARAARTRR